MQCYANYITTSISNRESNLMKNMAAAAITIFIFCIMGVATSVEEGEAFLMVYIRISEHVVVFSCEFKKGTRAVCRNFAKGGGKFGVRTKEGGARMTQGGATSLPTPP